MTGRRHREGCILPTRTTWAPALALRFAPSEIIVRLFAQGYGIFFSMMDGQSIRQLERNPPAGRIASLAADQDANSNGPLAVRTWELFPAQGTLATRPNIYTDIGARPDPYIQQWNLSIQRQVFAEYDDRDRLPGIERHETGLLRSRQPGVASGTRQSQAPS